ncbi:hypothetical protein KAR91_32380 [Candidatus Pacearchaeota archaeon]|nr:hypothetical protein [Candidatus Pacearchaeota archaeon]
MKDLFAAIKSLFDGDPLSASVSDLYNTEADDDAVYPYIVFSLIGNTPDFTFEEDFEGLLVQFDVYSCTSSVEEICDIFELVKGDKTIPTGFDFRDIPIDNYSSVSSIRQNAVLSREEKTWHYSVVYAIVVQKD